MSKKSIARLLVKNLVLRPLSVAYGAVTATRNKMFEAGVLSQRVFDIPVLCVGNIAVGGTGKTPHTEYLIELLQNRFNIGVLSRGYNRKTRGFRMADEHSTARDIGDEPLQIYRKFSGKGVRVAVCEDRSRGIDKMREMNPEINLVILDDAFQHRYVKPTVSVVLTEYSRPVFNDRMLPAGHLRENIGALHRADMVIVTKCPSEMKQLDYRLFDMNLKLFPYQKLFFSRYDYGELQPVFPDDTEKTPRLEEMTQQDTIVVLAGIANPRPLVKYLRKSTAKIKGLVFNDHHNFVREDMVALVTKMKESENPKRAIVVTTEKDAMRLRGLEGLPKGLRKRMFYIPIKVRIIPNPTSQTKAGAKEFAEELMRRLRQASASQANNKQD